MNNIKEFDKTTRELWINNMQVPGWWKSILVLINNKAFLVIKIEK